MLIGPVFSRELTTFPRSIRLYLMRGGYVAALFGLAFTTWLVFSQQVHGLGGLARFGSIVFSLIAPLQLAMAVSFSALLTAASVAQEKDRRTLDLLLMTNLSNAELVLGKLSASMLSVLVMIFAAIPLFMAFTLLGGISYLQVLRVLGVTLAAAIAAGSLGSTIALWRERTFQSLALTALLLVLWLLGGEIVRSSRLGEAWFGISAEHLAIAFSPMRAIFAAMHPIDSNAESLEWCGGPVGLFLLVSIVFSLLLNAWAMLRVRIWNPTQAAERQQPPSLDLLAPTTSTETVHSRTVWDNPILWREICTWAYGKKIIVVRLGYLVIFSICAAGLFTQLSDNTYATSAPNELVHSAAKPVIPLIVLGLILVNALADTSLTNERDLRALDLLLVTDLTPKEIIYGKLGGIFFNSKEMILLPLCLCGVLWYHHLLSTENLVFLCISTLVLNIFVAMVGVHVGMTYAESRKAVGVSLGTVLFLLLGIAVCMRMMMAVQSSFFYQLQAFSAFMLGGSIALYMALGLRNPSRAIGLACGIAPVSTFYVITSFIDQQFGGAFLVVVLTYGFSTVALLIPAIDEFDVATGRTIGEA